MNKPKAKRKPNLKRRAKKAAIRAEKEQQMAEYLLGKGWEVTGVMQDVWTLPDWKPEKSGLCRKSLRGAYEIQQRLDAQGFARSPGIDTDLTQSILDD
jgi:hypothetical protein